jgi:hypothetical protein
VAALRQAPGGPAPAARPRPEGTELRAPLEGKAVAMSRLVPRVAQCAGPSIQPRVALTDGAAALPQQVGTHVPESTVLLDVIHATEYLWDTATAWLGETHPQRLAWVRAYLEPLRAGQNDAVITAVAAEATDPPGTGDATAGGAAAGGRLPMYPALYARRCISGAWLADWDGRGGRCLWTPRQRSPGTGGDALDHRRRAGRARPAGGTAQWPLGSVWAVSSATTPSAAVWSVRPGPHVGSSPRAGVGCLINRLSTQFGHTQMISRDPEIIRAH